MVRSVLAASLRFRMLLVGIAAGVIVLGVISLRQMHTDTVPELASGPVLNVQTEALGLSSQEVEQYVTVFKHQRRNLVQRVMCHHPDVQLRDCDLDPDGLDARGNSGLMRGDHGLAYEGRSRRPIKTHGRQL